MLATLYPLPQWKGTTRGPSNIKKDIISVLDHSQLIIETSIAMLVSVVLVLYYFWQYTQGVSNIFAEQWQNFLHELIFSGTNKGEMANSSRKKTC